MQVYTSNNKENKIPFPVKNQEQSVQFKDNRSEKTAQLKAQEMANQPIQRKANKTGMPDSLKSGIENLSGYAMDDVKVHYNSSKPAQLQAHAYAQGNQIHLGPGQEKHLPHEAWHVVQQKQGRVTPTKQLKGKTNINDDAGLEKEADLMGEKALKNSNSNENTFQNKSKETQNVQNTSLKETTPTQLVTQKVSSVIVGESHALSQILVSCKDKPGGSEIWKAKAEPSKVAASLIQHNSFSVPGNFHSELEKQSKNATDLKRVMETAQNIFRGHESKWGAEDNLLGIGSKADEQGVTVAPQDARTHIESPLIRWNAASTRELSTINITKASLVGVASTTNAYNILNAKFPVKIADAERYIKSSSPAVQAKWASLKAATGKLGEVIPTPATFTYSDVTVTPSATQIQNNWADQMIMTINRGLHEFSKVANEETSKLLTGDFNKPLANTAMVEAIKSKYSHNHSPVGAEMHATASLSRTLTQLDGMNKLNASTAQKTPEITKLGYLVGDSHLADFNLLLQHHKDDDGLRDFLTKSEIVREATYGNLKNSTQSAINKNGLDTTVKVS